MHLNSRRLLALAALFLAIAASRAARADDVYTFIVKKQETKKSYNWWLTDWLEKRDKMRLMDLWLALHTPTPYEFFVGGSYVSTGSSKGNDFHAGAFNRIFGLEFHRDSSVQTRYTGLFNFRIFGYFDQATNITLQGGLRSTSLPQDSTRSPLVGAKADLYLAPGLGVHGLYRHFYRSTPNAMDVRVSGDRWEGGGFIEFKVLRIYGNYISEPETTVTNNVTTATSRTGWEAGARIYF